MSTEIADKSTLKQVKKTVKKKLQELLSNNLHVGCTVENDNEMTYMNNHTLKSCISIAAAGATCGDETKSCPYMAYLPNANGDNGKCWVGKNYNSTGNQLNSKCKVPVFAVPPDFKQRKANCQDVRCLANSEAKYLQEMNQKHLESIKSIEGDIDNNAIKLKAISEGIDFQTAKKKYADEKSRLAKEPYLKKLEETQKQYQHSINSFKDFYNSYNTVLDQTDRNINTHNRKRDHNKADLAELEHRIQTQDELIKQNNAYFESKSRYARHLKIALSVIAIIAFFAIPFFLFRRTQINYGSNGNSNYLGISPSTARSKPSANGNSTSIYDILDKLGIKN